MREQSLRPRKYLLQSLAGNLTNLSEAYFDVAVYQNPDGGIGLPSRINLSENFSTLSRQLIQNSCVG